MSLKTQFLLKKGFILAKNPTYNFKQNQTQTICNKQSGNPSQCALGTREKYDQLLYRGQPIYHNRGS